MRRAAFTAAILMLALATSPAFADTGLSVGSSYPVFASSPSFRTLMQGIHGKWIRLGVSYDAVWTSNGTGCVAPSASGAQQWQLFNAMWTAERQGYRPLIAIEGDQWGATADYRWPAGAHTQQDPSDLDEQCGVAGIEYAISTWRLGQWRMPVEAFNEPDFGAGLPISVYQAVNYFADTVRAGWGDSWFRPVAGVFATGYGADSPGSYAWQYIAALTSSPYNRWASSWSWHDYGDVVHSPNCGWWVPSQCGRFETDQMLSLLRGWHEPTSDMWITESGDAQAFEPGVTRIQEAREGYAWERLRGAGEQHLLWYEFQSTSNDSFDSALVDPDPRSQLVQTGYGPRDPSFCVLAYNELPFQAVRRCGG